MGHVRKGKAVIHLGEPVSSAYLVRGGVLAAEFSLDATEGGIYCGIFQRNSLYVPTLEDGSLSHVTLSAVTSADVLAIPRAYLRSLALANPALLVGLHESTVNQFQFFAALMAVFPRLPVEYRILCLYWCLSDETLGKDGSRRLPGRFTHEVTSRFIGASREEVTRKLKLLVSSGLLLEDARSYSMSADVAFLLQSKGIPDVILSKKSPRKIQGDSE